MDDKEANQDQVGYGNPPKSGQFKKGQSGNRKGRPKGTKNRRPKLMDPNFTDLILTEGKREISLQDKDGPITMTVERACFRAMYVKAAKGDPRALGLLARYSKDAKERREKEGWEEFKAAAEYKTRRAQVLKTCKSRDLDPNRGFFFPDPDHIILDTYEGTVVTRGPVTAQEQEDWDLLWRVKEGLAEACQDTEKVRAKAKPDERDAIEILDGYAQALTFYLNLVDAFLICRWHLRLEDVVSDEGRAFQVEAFIHHANHEKGRFPKAPKVCDRLFGQIEAEGRTTQTNGKLQPIKPLSSGLGRSKPPVLKGRAAIQKDMATLHKKLTKVPIYSLVKIVSTWEDRGTYTHEDAAPKIYQKTLQLLRTAFEGTPEILDVVEGAEPPEYMTQDMSLEEKAAAFKRMIDDTNR